MDLYRTFSRAYQPPLNTFIVKSMLPVFWMNRNGNYSDSIAISLSNFCSRNVFTTLLRDMVAILLVLPNQIPLDMQPSDKHFLSHASEI